MKTDILNRVLYSIIFFLCSFTWLSSQTITIYEEDFESYATGEITSTTSVYPHQFDGAGNTSTKKWEVSPTTSPTCSTCADNRARVQYGASGEINENTLVLGAFANNFGASLSVDISFDYAFKAGGSSFLSVELYDETIASGVSTFINVSTDTDASYAGSETLTDGHTYTIRAYYEGAYDWYAAIDNILVSYSCSGMSPSYTATRECVGDFSSYNIEIYVTSLGTASSVDITDGITTYESGVGTGTYSITGVSGSITVKVVDHDNSLTCYDSQSFNDCDICSESPSLPQDECENAPLIDLSQPFTGSTNCTYTISSGSPSVCGQTIENDSWMRFIAASSDVELDYTIGDCNNDNGIQLAVFSGECGSLSNISGSCVSPSGELTTGAWSFSGLTVGDTYYIRIDGYAGDLCDYYFEPVAGVVLTPDNDECADATSIACGDSEITSNILATDTDAPTACSGGGTAGKGLWYVFSGNGQEVTISTDNTGTNFDTQINVFSGTCGSLTCVGGDDDSGTGTTSSYTFLTANGTDYYIYVDGDGAAEGQFELSVSCTDACIADPGIWQY